MKWIIAVVLLSLLLVSAIGFGAWAFSERQDYKNNTDQKVAVAVEAAKKTTTEENNKQFAEELKNPLKTYTGPSSYGSIKLTYPKTYSGYVSTNVNGTTAVDAYFHPDFVPSLIAQPGSTTRGAIALRVQVLNQAYDSVVLQYQSAVTSGIQAASPYALPKMPGQVGTKFVGKLASQLNGTEIVLPLRDKTLIITTETDQYLHDFNTHILPNFTFVP